MFGAPLGFDVKGYAINEALPSEHWAQKFQFMFRPTTVETEIAPVYEDQAVMGMSHDAGIYSHTGAMVVTFELYWNALMGMREKSRFAAGSRETDGRYSAGREGGREDLARWGAKIEDGRRFLEALTVAPAGTPGMIGGTSPATAILALKGVCTIRARLTALKFTFEDFDAQGNIRELRAATSWRERPTMRFTMEDVLAAGASVQR